MMRAVAPRGGHGLFGHQRRGLRQRAEDATGVKPAGAERAEDLVPVDVAGFQLRDGGVPAIGATQRGAHAEASLGEVEAVAHGAADAVVLHPGHALFDAALEHQVFHEAAHRVVGQRGHDGGVEPEAALQPARDVVLAAAFPDLEGAGGVDAAIARVEAQHHFAQGDAVPAAGFRRAQHELRHRE